MMDEPSITLPTRRLIATTVACCAIAAAVWAGVGAALGYGSEVLLSGAIAAGLTALAVTIGLLVTMPWIAKPVTTTMAVWLGSDMLSMLLALGGAYLLYSATRHGDSAAFLGLTPLLIGVALSFFLVLLGKAAVVAAHMRTHSH